MTIRHIRIFITVYQQKNMTAAAKKLSMTQPSVSQTIKELEEYFNVALFERLSHKLYVTEAGEKLYQYAIHMTELLDDMETNIKGSATHGSLRIGANYTIGSVMIHRYIRKFSTIYPEMEVRVNVNLTPVLTQMLKRNELDLALMEDFHDMDLKREAFAEDEIVFVANPRHPVFSIQNPTADHIVQQRLLLRESGSDIRSMVDAQFHHIGLPIRPFWESTSTMALINAAIDQIGIAVLPGLLVKRAVEAGKLRILHVPGVNLQRRMSVFYHKNKFLTDTIKEFIHICRTTE